MKKILHIISSVKGKDSFSIKLADALIDKLSSVYRVENVHTHDLTKSPFPHLEETHLGSFYTPDEARTAEQKEAVSHSEQSVKELMEADIIVIGVPIYNFNIPSTLKAWIDHVVRAGFTFSYKDGVPKGLFTDKKVFLAISSGGVFSDGPLKNYDFAEPYLRYILGFIGLTDITTFRIEGMMMPEFKDIAVQKAIDSINNYEYEAMTAQV
ncbi:MAG: FMN-dependent NADH-azoreductase [Bacteroidetes bacterium]|nr:FMN-dependent NADH-azoreductase [Bacteroidota bacterium]